MQQAALAAARWALISVKTDASSRNGLRDVARRLEAVVDIDPDLDLLGVVLFGANRTARRVSDTARAASTDDLGSPAAVFTTPSAAAGQTSDVGEGLRSRSATGLAEDFQAFGEVVIDRIAAHEAAQSEPTTAGSAR